MAIKVGMISLGCSKNQVDAEIMLSLLEQGGYELCGDAQQCDVVIINTCGFIEDAKKESIETILEFCQLKALGKVKVIVVTGCLAERYRQELAQEIPEADVVLGIGRNSEIVQAIQRALAGKRVVAFGEKDQLPLNGDRVLTTPNYYAYLKVADGCNNRCSYCAIPLIRGAFRSRRMEDIIAEAKGLAREGVKELNVVAQDTTRYGEDLYGRLALPELLRELCRIPEIRWVRILYCYPDRVTDELLEVMAQEEKIVKYMDLPIQHASGKVLQEMNRRGDRASLEALMAKIREKVPGVILRTTLIAGFPGETQEDFAELCEFVQNVKFERLGCFAYSQEENTPAGEREDQIDEETKQRRVEVLMTAQMANVEAFNRSMLGKTLPVLVEGYEEESGLYYGRSPMDAPDIDTRTYFTAARPVQAGDFVDVTIQDVLEYDLLGQAQ